MKPPADVWVPWIYRVGMALIGLFGMASMVWLYIVIAYGDWPADMAGKRLEALATFGLCNLALLGVQQIGLVARNLVRNIKFAGPGGVSVDVTSHEGTAK